MMRRKMFYGANRLIFENAKALRKNLTTEELIFWGRLKEWFPGYKFRRQHPIANYIVDFYCHKINLVIEIDGSIHFAEENQMLDEQRQKDIENLGLTVLRFTNDQIKNHCEFALIKIEDFIKVYLLENVNTYKTV